jgi:hypothetical protein
MYRFHVDLYSIDAEKEARNKEFTTIVPAADVESAIQRAKSVLQEKMPGLVPANSWNWAVYQMPLG